MRRALAGAAAVLAVAVTVAAPDASAARPTATERAILRAVNHQRAVHGLRAVRFAGPLQTATHHYAVRLLRTNRFVHGALPPNTRENLAWATANSGGARTIVGLWMSSPGHRRTLLWPAARRAGVGAVRGPYLGYRDALLAVLRFRG
jgi:uncharacterized protein YkwD